ncbi:hypothetical protein EDB80DRAFT_876669 [Ilyonectria destructans]|nr:hypothetical protein EDB80DRAFT_876669 [Ilyonectria destructans]
MPDEVFVTVALNGIRETNEVWYNNWAHDMEKGNKITKDQITSFLTRQANAEKNQKSNFSAVGFKKPETEAAATQKKHENSMEMFKDRAIYFFDCPAMRTGLRHKKTECWVKHPEKRPAARQRSWRNNSQSEGNAAITTAGTNFNGMTLRKTAPDDAVNVPKTTKQAMSFSATKDDFHDEILVDSGCSDHCFNDKKWFTFFMDVEGAEMMTTSNGGDLDAV